MPGLPIPSRRTDGFAIALVMLLSATSLHAQRLPDAFVGSGDRLRVTTYRAVSGAEARRIGVLQRVSTDSVTLSWSSGQLETLPMHRIARLEVSDGGGSFVGVGAAAGLLGGAVVGAVAGATSSDRNDDYFALSLVVHTIGGALAGSIVGGLVGAVGRRERWTRVRLDQPLRRVSITSHAAPMHTARMSRGIRVRVLF